MSTITNEFFHQCLVEQPSLAYDQDGTITTDSLYATQQREVRQDLFLFVVILDRCSSYWKRKKKT